MTISMDSEKKEWEAADQNEDRSYEADLPEEFEECTEPNGTSLSDILRQAVNAADSTDRASGRCSARRKKKMISENVIEREFVKAVRLAGGIAYNFALPEADGMPDRLVLFPSGASAFVEIITPEKVLNPIRTLRRRQLEYLGYPVICIEHLEQIIPAIRAILTWNSGEPFPGIARLKASRYRGMETDGTSDFCGLSDSEESDRNNLRQVIVQLQREAYQQLQIQKLEDMRVREEKREQERRKGRKPVNTECEFYDRKDNRDICLIHMDMYFCSRDCAFATTGAGSTLPYGSKYMKGRL